MELCEKFQHSSQAHLHAPFVSRPPALHLSLPGTPHQLRPGTPAVSEGRAAGSRVCTVPARQHT